MVRERSETERNEHSKTGNKKMEKINEAIRMYQYSGSMIQSRCLHCRVYISTVMQTTIVVIILIRSHLKVIINPKKNSNEKETAITINDRPQHKMQQ